MLSLLAQLEAAEEVAGREEWGPFLNLSPELRGSFRQLVTGMADLLAQMLDAVVDEIKSDDIMAQAARALDLYKLALTKAGAKHAKADKDRIKQAHDLLVDLDPDCCPADEDEEDDADKLRKQLDAERVANGKLLNETILPSITKLSEQIAAIGASVKTIADQPMPMGTSSVTLRVVDKASDSTDFGKVADKLDGGGSGDDDLTRLADAAQRHARTQR
jgi:hypothetical protein